jgi:hypothetical protein
MAMTNAIASFGSCAVSEDSEIIQKSIEEIRRLGRGSITGQSLDYLHNSLWEVYKECSENNWDGYGAEAISPEAYFEASKLIESLPLDLPFPEIVPEPSGAIGFEWENDKQDRFIVSVKGQGIISYAGVFGPSNEACGTEYFLDLLPSEIVHHLYRFFKK